MNMKITLLVLILLPLMCMSQSREVMGVYSLFFNNKNHEIILYDDSTYDFISYWGSYHGYYEIWPQDKWEGYDLLCFYDDLFYVKKGAAYSNHISIEDTVISLSTCTNVDFTPYYVTMFDITGEIISYYSACFCDSTGNLIHCHHNDNGNINGHGIPTGTETIELFGPNGNMTTVFRTRYDIKEGNVAFIVGPATGPFRIKKNRSNIIYLKARCRYFNKDCCLTFLKKEEPK